MKMINNNAMIVFQDKNIRRKWFNDEWWFVIKDIIFILTVSKNPSDYLKKLRKRNVFLNDVFKGRGQIVPPLGLEFATSGGRQMLQCWNTAGLLRLIQSVPSKKAEPFKLWLAKVGSERIDEIQDPELAFDRAMQTYLQKGYSKEWINQRLKTIEVRKELADEWNRVGIEKQEDFAILTNELTEAWSGKSIKDYKIFKGLKKENLRDNMTNLELVLNMLAEVTTKEFSKKEDPKTFNESKIISKKGGSIAGNTRKDIEKQLGEPVVNSKNAKEIHFKSKKKIEKK